MLTREEAQADPALRDAWSRLDAKSAGRVSREDFDKFRATMGAQPRGHRYAEVTLAASCDLAKPAFTAGFSFPAHAVIARRNANVAAGPVGSNMPSRSNRCGLRLRVRR